MHFSKWGELKRWWVAACLTAFLIPAGSGCERSAETPAIGTAPRQTLLDAVREVDFIAEVTVRRVTGRDGTTGRARTPAIWSDVEFEVHRVWLDRQRAAGETITMSFLGGVIGEREFWLSGGPHFAEGERLVLFATPGQKPWPTYRGAAGVLRIENERLYTLDGREVRRISDDGITGGSAKSSRQASLPVPHGTAGVRPVPAGALASPLSFAAFADELERIVGKAEARALP